MTNLAKLTKEEQSEIDRFFESMINEAPVLMWKVDSDKQYVYLNQAWSDFSGIKNEHENGTRWLKRIHPSDIKRAEDVSSRAFRTRKPFSIKYRALHHDGQYRWLLDKGRPYFRTDGSFSGFIGSCVDIDEIVELSEKNDQLEIESSRLQTLNQAKDEFISLASHQLRTPATGVKQYVGMLLEGYAGKLTAPVRKMLETAYGSNERQLNIVDDLLRVAHIDSGKVILKKESVCLVAMVGDIIKEQNSKFEKRNQKVSLTTSNKKINAKIDKQRLRMAIENIIDNASKYTSPGNSIDISINQTTENVTVSVKDKGVGIPMADHDKLFQKFSRINNSLSTQVGGTGLGLYWAHNIVKLHNGTIAVSSRPNIGSTFVIRLPNK